MSVELKCTYGRFQEVEGRGVLLLARFPGRGPAALGTLRLTRAKLRARGKQSRIADIAVSSPFGITIASHSHGRQRTCGVKNAGTSAHEQPSSSA